MATIYPTRSDSIHPRSERVILIGQWIVVIGLSLLGGERVGEASTRAGEIELQYRGEGVTAVLPLEADAWKATPWGGKIAVISGNPDEHAPFVIRVKLPPGYALPPRRWRNEENIVVLSGTLEVGTGSTLDPLALRALPSGSFISLAANQPHFARSRNGAVIQIFGEGPFKLEASSVGACGAATASLRRKRYRTVSTHAPSISAVTASAERACRQAP